ncbi:protein of unknown function DUF262 [Nitrosococcus halophilus Nc 4]|uniref:DUF262 domain-containing protein n=1 Tax=Nitrosococcus halophilus (strain Nc4) TaxID=472759 RepID=D5C4B5_NITHN|nr:DUF262 domain-containing HNH endonuclease family protein [Nitrosococcus halophilus]ADE13303.1 protein of unknown function DUF262 [Nitrosococcus halophilus Nc 4]
MSIDIENIFKATAQSTWHFLITNGQGCYIPAYQRPYSWDEGNVERLFEDAAHGMKSLLKRGDTISFLGTIIAFHDTKHRTVQPIFQQEVASKVMTIIDGQQRICTFLMANMVIHDHVRRMASKFKNKEEPQFTWLAEQTQQLIAELEDSFVLDMKIGEGNYRYYPRMIRSYEDVWSKRKGQAKYNSPIARLIWEFFCYQKTEETKPFRYIPKDNVGNPHPHYQPVVTVFKYIQRQIDQITGKKASEADFPDVLAIIQSEDFIDAIWGFDLPSEVKTYIIDHVDDTLYDLYCQLLRLIVFARYLNNRMAFTVVTTRSEDDAFDMFEALNTTGEPLTAFETFKPKVIDEEGISKYEHSPSYKCISRIEEYLENFRKAEQKQKATSEMLVPFALAETGDKLQKRLNDQRRYLREQYEGGELSSINEKREFVRRLAYVASFMKNAWDTETAKKPSFFPLTVVDDAVLVGFEALRELKHHITIAPLSRFYGRALETDDETEQATCTAEFVDAIKATVAFSMLWRGAFGGTSNIDRHYRDIMRQSTGKDKIPPLAKRPKSGTGAVSIANYKKALRTILEEKGSITSRDDWVKATARTPVYKYPVIARFLLFLASDDAIVDKSEPGLVIRGRKGLASMLALNRWRDKDYFTVEHIAPQSNTTGWQADIYDDADAINRLGNLILLPPNENSLLGNRSWEHKRLLYRVLAAEDQESFDKAKAACSAKGLTLSKKAEEILDKANYLGLCKSVASKNDDWSLGFIEKRSRCIAGLAWDRLAPWLDFI